VARRVEFEFPQGRLPMRFKFPILKKKKKEGRKKRKEKMKNLILSENPKS
jgi:hypothetical protein